MGPIFAPNIRHVASRVFFFWQSYYLENLWGHEGVGAHNARKLPHLRVVPTESHSTSEVSQFEVLVGPGQEDVGPFNVPAR